MNIFVANLNYRIRRDNLLAIFSEYGEVSHVKVIMDRETGRSKGYGFVEMPNDSEALRAVAELNGAEWEAKIITVKVSEPNNPVVSSPTLSGHGGSLPKLSDELI